MDNRILLEVPQAADDQPARLNKAESLIVILLLSLGLWVAIWKAVTSQAAAALRQPSSANRPHQSRAGGASTQSGSPALVMPLARNDGSSPRSASAAQDAPRLVEHLGLRAQTEPQQKVRHEHRQVTAGGAIDLDEIAMPEILDPRGCIRVRVPGLS